LDFTARQSVLGKPVGSDLREGKVTLPLIYALREATAEERQSVEMVLEDRSYGRVPFESVLAMLDRRGAIGRAQERARAFTEQARRLISGFPDSPYQRALLGITELVTERDC
jgi:octaprenyl-diphosphate synthase